MRFVFGLGNPEARFDDSPHNVGYASVDRAAALLNLDPVTTGTGILLHQTGEKIFLCKPSTVYMNESGQHIRDVLAYYKVEPSADTLLVIHDDLDLPIGSLRGKTGGGTGGHNGIKSIIQELDTQDFYRVKIGVGRHEHKDPYTYVTSKMDDDRLDKVEPIIDRAAQVALEWLHGRCKEGFKYDERDHMRSSGDQVPD